MARYDVVYDEQAVDELRALRKFDRVNVIAAIERHLFDQPTAVSRMSIKKLELPVIAGYRLRVGEYRVFYDVDEDDWIVHVIAIRYKGTVTIEEAADGKSD